jgi:hypothetical protein
VGRTTGAVVVAGNGEKLEEVENDEKDSEVGREVVVTGACAAVVVVDVD